METETLVLLILIVIVVSLVWLAWRQLSLQREIARLSEAPEASLGLLQREIQSIGAGVDRRLSEHLQNDRELRQSLGRLQRATEGVERFGVSLDELHKVLQPPQLRGAFGERLLEDAVAEVLPRERYRIQYTYPSTGVRVDLAILFDDGRLLPIDSKFPLDNYRRAQDLMQAGDPGGEAALRAFHRDVRRHIDDVAARYLSPRDGALDVAFMYIPSEAVFHAVGLARLEEGCTLVEHALRKRVVPVSPHSLHAYLSVVRMGLRGFQLQRGARDLLERLEHLRSDADELRSRLETAATQARHSLANLMEADSALRGLEGRLEGLERSEPPESPPRP